MKNLRVYTALFCIIGSGTALFAQTQKHNFVPEDGYVPDAKTAIRVAVAVWSPIYGEKHIQGEKLFKAKLNKGIWVVEGSPLPKDWSGGVAVAEISKKDGRILRVSHGR